MQHKWASIQRKEQMLLYMHSLLRNRRQFQPFKRLNSCKMPVAMLHILLSYLSSTALCIQLFLLFKKKKAVLELLAGAGTNTVPLFSRESTRGNRKWKKGIGRNVFLEPARSFLGCLCPCHRPALSWTASFFGHVHKIISYITFAG